MERVIDCPICYDVDRCFEDIQEGFNSYLCFSCGYMSSTHYEEGSLTLIDNLKKSPKLVQDLQIVDKDRNIVWFLSVINMGEKGMIFPEGKPESWVWKYAKVVDVPEEERSQYGGHDKKLDLEGAETFGQKTGFLEACKKMGLTSIVVPEFKPRP